MRERATSKPQSIARPCSSTRSAIRIDGAYPEARLGLAETYERAGDMQNAYREYVRAADVLPARLDVQLRAGNFLLVAGRFDDAGARAEKVLEAEPNNVEAQVLLGYSLAGLKRLDDAVTQLERALTTGQRRGRRFQQPRHTADGTREFAAGGSDVPQGDHAQPGRADAMDRAGEFSMGARALRRSRGVSRQGAAARTERPRRGASPGDPVRRPAIEQRRPSRSSRKWQTPAHQRLCSCSPTTTAPRASSTPRWRPWRACRRTKPSRSRRRVVPPRSCTV